MRSGKRRIHPTDAGWSSLVARRAHNPKVVGSIRLPQPNIKRPLEKVAFFVTSENLAA